jgi:guanylate kinase
MFEITSFQDLIGIKKIMSEWNDIVKNIQAGEIFILYGYSGVGKTIGTKLLLKEYNYQELYIDSSICGDGKEILDRMVKFHQWMNLGACLKEEVNVEKKVIIIDEIESLVKLDRNVLNHILSYKKQYGNLAHPILLIGHIDMQKKLGDMKNYITHMIRLPRLQDIDIFLFLKKRIPKNKIKLVDLMRLAEDAAGNIYTAIQSVQQVLQQKKGSVLLTNYQGDEQKTFSEIFDCKNPEMIHRLLMEDSWMHPLKIHENIIKILDTDMYYEFLQKYIVYETWNSRIEDFSHETANPMYYLTMIILYILQKQGNQVSLENMEFSKLLSYISTQTKYRKMMYDKIPCSYPIEEVGLYWIQTSKESGKRGKSKDDENFL